MTHPPVEDIDIHEAHRRAERGALMLDVREADEWRAGRMEGAVHVPLGELDPAALPKDRPIVAICRSGNRSRFAAQALSSAGHDAVNLAGGMKAWHAAGLSMVNDDGAPGKVG